MNTLPFLDPDRGVLNPQSASLAHLARVCAAGELAAGFAHELHQPLCAITLYADTCMRILQTRDLEPSVLRDTFADVKRQAMRAAALIKQLRRYVRLQAPAARVVRIADMIDRVLTLTDYEAANLGILTRVSIDASLPTVLAEPVQMEQVLHNLVRNAIDAIASDQPTIREVVIEARPLDTGWVEMDVLNSGGPIPKNTRQNMFRPFFTTKPEGLGMGLYVARLIMTAHHGTVECIPCLKGTTMRITLPTATNEQA